MAWSPFSFFVTIQNINTMKLCGDVVLVLLEGIEAFTVMVSMEFFL